MNGEAIGVIETIGMTAAVEAADSCVKSANVTLIGYELTTGGLVTIKIKGDVGAVKAAIDAGRISAERIGTVVGTLVIPRPAQNLHKIIESNSTVGIKSAEAESEKNLICDKEIEPQETLVSEKNLEPEGKQVLEKTGKSEEEPVPEETEEIKEESVPEETEEAKEEPVPEETEEAKEEPVPEETEEIKEESVSEETEEPKEESVPEEAEKPEDLALEKDIEVEEEKDSTPEKDIESEEGLTLKESTEPNNSNPNEETEEKDVEAAVKKDKGKTGNHVSSKKNAKDNEICNICRDPACPRRKGQPRHLCLHYKKMGK